MHPEPDILKYPDQFLDLPTFVGQVAVSPQAPRQWVSIVQADACDTCIHRLFEEQAERTPDAVAVMWQDGLLTYRAVNTWANQLAHHLRSAGVIAETPVAVFVGRSVEYVVAVLGILKAGGAYVPLTLDYPVDRLRFMLQDSGAALVIAKGPLPAGLQGTGLGVVDMGRTSAQLEGCSGSNPDSPDNAESLAYIMYTSGSTGRPKGVAVPHRAVVRLVRGQSYAEFHAGERFLLLAPTAFDASTFELWGPLLCGATCVVFPQETPDFARLEQFIRDYQISCLWLTAGLFNQIIDQRPSLLESVRHVLTGGDTLSVSHVRRARERLPHLRLTNGYGPTESTTFACTYDVQTAACSVADTVPIGRPIAHTYCRILDAYGHPVAHGVPGELYIGGDGLARGYVNLPDLTAERFLADPYHADPGRRLYRTGDFARYLPDGTIEFLGRRDQQVKICGFRIELGEIESTVGTHPGIQACAVVAVGGAPGEKRLAAYVVPRGDAPLSVRALRRYLAKSLPHHMLPSCVISVASLPLNANGKVDRKSLEEWAGEALPADAGSEPPRTEREQRLAGIWQAVLQRERVGIHDDFFDLGGNSLSAVSIVSRIHDEMGVLLPVSLFFANPTVHQLGKALDEERNHLTARRTEFAASEAAPLFLLGWYLDLIDLRLAGRRQYVLPFPEFDVTREQCRVEFLADTCLQLLRSIQPQGPYLLVGYSLAGLVAYEMACRLRAEGQAVQLVAIVDSAPAGWLRCVAPLVIGPLGDAIGFSFRTQLVLARSWDYLLDLVQSFTDRGTRQTTRSVFNDVRHIWHRWKGKKRLNTDPAESLAAEPAVPDPIAQPFGKFWAHRWADACYRPQCYDGRVAVFASEDMAAQYPEPGCGWKPWARSVREYIVPGDHNTCVRAHQKVLAEKLHDCLAELDSCDSRDQW